MPVRYAFMNKTEEKIALLLDMISFAVIDGKLDPREYAFLSLIAQELHISKPEFDDLFHREHKPEPIKSESRRIHQFYRLALLMHIDGVLHPREEKAIFEIGISMALNPAAMRRMLELMRESPTKILDPQLIFDLFRMQEN